MEKKIYLVGGACRDILMGNDPKDYDFVAVGYTVEDFKHMGQVGKDFPVFLEPTHGWEIALARVERKTGVGHTDFETEWNGVSLEDDLLRRDLTINAIAIEVDFEATVTMGQPVTVGTWIDPFDGMVDIEDSRLHYVSDAFEEDPLRCLRVARFASRYPDFWISPELTDKMTRMAEKGMLQNLTRERVWMEMEKALSTKTPSRFFKICVEYLGMFDMFNWMKRTPQPEEHHPEGDVCTHTMMVMDQAAKFGNPVITFAALCHDFGKPFCQEKYGKLAGHEEEGLRFIEGFCKRWRVPARYRNLALHTCKQHTKVHSVFGRNNQGWVKPKSIMKMFEDTAALTHPDRFRDMLLVCEADARGRGKVDDPNNDILEDSRRFYRDHLIYMNGTYLNDCLTAVLSVETKPISSALLEKGKEGRDIGEAIRVARIDAIRDVQHRWKEQS